jgi:hypothetical protein
MEKPYLTSTFSRTNRILPFATSVILYGFSIGFFFKYDDKDRTTLFFLIAGLVLFLMSTYFFVTFLKVFKIRFYSDRIELFQFFGLQKKKVPLTQIDSWILRKKKHKYGDFELLYIVLSDQSHLKFRSYSYSNFYLIINNLKDNKPQNRFLRAQLDRKEYNQFTFFFIAIGRGFIWFALNAFQNENTTRTTIYIVKGHLAENIQLVKSKNSRSLIVKLEEYPEYEFKIGSLILLETASGSLMNTYKKGDELKFAIEKTDYEKKIVKNQELSAWDLLFHYHTIAIVEVAETDFVYLSLENYNKAINSNNLGIVLFFGAFGISFTAFGFVRLRKKRLKPLNTNRRLP